MSAPVDPAEFVKRARSADATLLSMTTNLTDRDVAQASLLPGWTRGHVLAHLARHAEAHAKMLRGETDSQYPGGAEGRRADIEAGADRSATEHRKDLMHWSHELAATWRNVHDWDAEYQFMLGPGPAWRSPATRWREVEVHHVDLAVRYTASDWPDAFVKGYLPDALDSVESRLAEGIAITIDAMDSTISAKAGQGEPVRVQGPGWALLAWCFGRAVPDGALTVTGELPELKPWA